MFLAICGAMPGSGHAIFKRSPSVWALLIFVCGSWPKLGEFRSGQGIGESGMFLIAIWWWNWSRGRCWRWKPIPRCHPTVSPIRSTALYDTLDCGALVAWCVYHLASWLRALRWHSEMFAIAGATCRGNRGENHNVCGNCASCRILASRMGSSSFGGDSCEVQVHILGSPMRSWTIPHLGGYRAPSRW